MTDPDSDGSAQDHSARGTEAQAKQTRGTRIVRGFVETGVELAVVAALFLTIEALLGGVTYFHMTLLVFWWGPWLCKRYLFRYPPGDKGDKDA
ncbi:MAG: hypothetical protein OXF75_06645 [Acidimicrobiaceae bacterium]|nr:hypothetical protein [Acidimicrobiaceae bacterium]